MITFQLSDEERMLEETVRDFAAAELRPALRACEAARAASVSLLERHHALGLGAVALPEDLGGAGLGEVASALVAEGLGHGDAGLAVALSASHPASCVVLALGNDEQQARILKPVAERGVHLALALSEADGPGLGVGLTATRDGGAFALRGKKSFVAYGGDASGGHVVVAQLEPGSGFAGMAVFFVPPGTKGVTKGALHDVVGLRAVPFAEVIFDDVRVGADARLGDEDVTAPLSRALLRASLLGASISIGCARAAYDAALRYADERHAFGKPIGHFQAIAFLLADMAMEVDAARWMVWRAGAVVDAGSFDASLLAMAVAQAHDAATFVCERAVQIFGGAGFMRDHPVEKWMRDAKALSMYVGTTELMSSLVQSSVLGEWAPAPEDALPLSPLQPVLS